jgi:hypothetical protein
MAINLQKLEKLTRRARSLVVGFVVRAHVKILGFTAGICVPSRRIGSKNGHYVNRMAPLFGVASISSQPPSQNDQN